jgi:hypothetical protein
VGRAGRQIGIEAASLKESHVMPVEDLSVRALVREVIAEIAPDELPGLELYLDAYYRNPAVIAQRGREVPTGFAFGQDVVTADVILLTHFVLTAVQRGVSSALEEWSKGATAGAIGKLTGKLRRKAGPVAVPEPVAVQALSPELLAAVRDAAQTLLEARLGVGREQAVLMTDALIGLLAAKPADPR